MVQAPKGLEHLHCVNGSLPGREAKIEDVGIARHLSHADGQRTWTATGHLIVPALSRMRASRGEPLGMLIISHML